MTLTRRYELKEGEHFVHFGGWTLIAHQDRPVAWLNSDGTLTPIEPNWGEGTIAVQIGTAFVSEHGPRYYLTAGQTEPSKKLHRQ